MQTLIRSCLAGGLLLTGYVLGVSGVFAPGLLRAQDQPAELSDETINRLKDVFNTSNATMLELQRQGRYQPVIRGVNTFAVSVGGLDVLNDLETTQTVDPETFAGLYADRAIDDVAQHLSRDEDGRITYKGKVVRMYSISRLKRLFAARDEIAGVK